MKVAAVGLCNPETGQSVVKPWVPIPVFPIMHCMVRFSHFTPLGAGFPMAKQGNDAVPKP